jgi:hypothetical protein
MWDDVGVMRTAVGINRGVRRIAEIGSELMSIGVSGGNRAFNLSWHDWLNLRSLCDISEVIAKAGLERENSRGAHFREDFPDLGDLDSSYFTLARKRGDALQVSREPVRFTIVRPGHSILSDRRTRHSGRGRRMISIDVIQKTAEALMEKAAIEIPEDYLDGLAAAEVEDGDLSSFVLQAMLENYEAVKQDRRAMCGDTGCPRWYVKMGNEARIENGPIAGSSAAALPRTPPGTCHCGRIGFIHFGERIMTTMSVSARSRSNMHLNQTGID